MKARELTTQRFFFLYLYKIKTGTKIRKVENLHRDELKLLRLRKSAVAAWKPWKPEDGASTFEQKLSSSISVRQSQCLDMCHHRNARRTNKRRQLEER